MLVYKISLKPALTSGILVVVSRRERHRRRRSCGHVGSPALRESIGRPSSKAITSAASFLTAAAILHIALAACAS